MYIEGRNMSAGNKASFNSIQAQMTRMASLEKEIEQSKKELETITKNTFEQFREMVLSFTDQLSQIGINLIDDHIPLPDNDMGMPRYFVFDYAFDDPEKFCVSVSIGMGASEIIDLKQHNMPDPDYCPKAMEQMTLITKKWDEITRDILTEISSVLSKKVGKLQEQADKLNKAKNGAVIKEEDPDIDLD